METKIGYEDPAVRELYVYAKACLATWNEVIDKQKTGDSATVESAMLTKFLTALHDKTEALYFRYD